jgi:polar amino acid transport system substrate-binding protein
MPHRLLAVGLGLLLAIAAPNAAPAAENALERINKAGVVRVAVPDNFPPFGNMEADAKLHGYDVDVAALIAEALGANLDLVAVASTDRIPALTGGKVDLVISTLGKDPERARLIDFSIAYAPFYSAVYGPASLDIAKPADLAGKSIAVTRNTIEDTALTQVAPADATIKRFDDNAGTQVAFLSSETDLIATGNAVAGEMLEKSLVKRTALKFILRNSPCYVGVAKGQPELVARVNLVLDEARKDGQLDRISERWLKAPLDDPEHPASMAATRP